MLNLHNKFFEAKSAARYYKTSKGYVVEKIDGSYAVLSAGSKYVLRFIPGVPNFYQDLVDTRYSWTKSSGWFRCCLRPKSKIEESYGTWEEENVESI